MSERKKFPAQLKIFAFSGAAGVLVTTGILVAMSTLMVSCRFSGSTAAPLATTAVGAGSFFGGWLAAFSNHKGGLVCGALLGSMFAALIVILGLSSGCIMDHSMLFRAAAVILSGSFGGFLGVRWPDRRQIAS